MADWGAALDFVETEDGRGLPFAAADPRIKAAVLGLMGNWGPNGRDLMTLAVNVTCPLRFLM